MIKKYKNISKDKLREEVKNWFFKQTLENRIKICTVENEFFSQIIYQMFLLTKNDNTVKFYPKTELLDIYEIKKNIILNNLNDINDSLEFKFETYFESKFEKSFCNNYNLFSGEIYNNEEEYNDKNFNSRIDEFINEIIFYSVHHKPYPDCFCLSPSFLLKEERFDTTFNYFGNINYFHELIQPFNDENNKIYGYKLPFWLSNTQFYSITHYIFAFIEQAIMIKYILYKYSTYNNKKNNNNFSLINDENLNRIFIDRKTVINYLNNNYNSLDSKKELVINAKFEKILDEILKNNTIMGKIAEFKNFRRTKNYNGFAGSLLVLPLLGIDKNNIHNTLYDNIRSFLNHSPEKQNNDIINKVKTNIYKIIEINDNIIFVDYLLFQSFKGIW